MKDFRDYLKPEEVERMLDCAKDSRDYLIIRLLWKTGMRVSELANMEVSWIDFEERMLTVFGKGKKWRRIPIDRDTLILLQNYLKNEEIKSGRCFDITRQRIFQILKDTAAQASIEKQVHPHTLRHSYAVNYLKKGGNLRNLQLNLGHAKLDTTAIYLQVTALDRKEEYNKIMSNE
ncbi:MAG: tyrosine-type recombinase/integrase [Candidatus Thermoplasmatota archaeon]